MGAVILAGREGGRKVGSMGAVILAGRVEARE